MNSLEILTRLLKSEAITTEEFAYLYQQVTKNNIPNFPIPRTGMGNPQPKTPYTVMFMDKQRTDK